MTAFLVAGSPDAQRPAWLAPGPGDYVIAVDRGLLHARAWGWPVHLLIGDLDSLPEREAGWTDAAPEVVTAPVAKDETDLELALGRALARGERVLVICAALGGRSDHMLANILLLCRPDLQGLDVVIAEGHQTLRLLRGGETLALAGKQGDLLSLLPVHGPAEGVTTDGLLYPLHDETLAEGQARGMSNIFLGSSAGVSLRAGSLLVFHQSSGP
jgi:thiamine pyrophosphokinase